MIMIMISYCTGQVNAKVGVSEPHRHTWGKGWVKLGATICGKKQLFDIDRWTWTTKG